MEGSLSLTNALIFYPNLSLVSVVTFKLNHVFACPRFFENMFGKFKSPHNPGYIKNEMPDLYSRFIFGSNSMRKRLSSIEKVC